MKARGLRSPRRRKVTPNLFICYITVPSPLAYEHVSTRAVCPLRLFGHNLSYLVHPHFQSTAFLTTKRTGVQHVDVQHPPMPTRTLTIGSPSGFARGGFAIVQLQFL
jgi:hypothetical protein